MIYTSYFGQLRNFPVNFIPVSICGGVPEWYDGAQYKKVAPKWSFFSVWKSTHDDEYYVEHFNREVLGPLNPQKVLDDIQALIPEKIRNGMSAPVWENDNVHVVLLCYEKRGDFCHRHLVSKWINDWAGKDLVQEWYPEEEKQMEALGMGLAALGKSIGTCAVSFAFVYIVGIGCKTFLIYTGKAKMDEFKNWFKFRDGRR